MGRKLVRENELLRSGGLLSFPQTGCALRAVVILTCRRGLGITVALDQGESAILGWSAYGKWVLTHFWEARVAWSRR